MSARLPAISIAASFAVCVLGCGGGGSRRSANPAPPGIHRLIELGKPIYCGGQSKPYVALTFDDGPTRRTPELLRVLRRYGARATFFEIGERAARRPDLVRLEAASGAVGDHSWSHPNLPGLGHGRVSGEIDAAKRAIERASGKPVLLFRPPFGAHDQLVDRVSRDEALLMVLWSVDSGDASEVSTPPSSEIAGHLAQRVRPGAIVLLHEDETVPRAIDALRIFLPELRRRGLRAVTVPELLDLDPPAPGNVANGVAGCS